MEGVSSDYEERMSRLEAIVARAERANELAHEHFRDEDTMILKSQMALHTSQQTLVDVQRKMLEQQEEMVESQQQMRVEMVEIDRRLSDAMEKMSIAMRETTEKLDALIRVVDGLIPRNGTH